MALHLNWCLLDVEVPVLDRLLLEEDIAHLLDLLHLVIRSDPSLSKCIPHTCAFTDAFRYTIKHAELRWQVVVLVSDLDEEEWLVASGDLLVIDLGEILGHRRHLVVVHELVLDGILVKVDIAHDVGPLVAPIGDDTLLRELSSNHLLPACLVLRFVLELHHPLQTARGRHELEDAVDGQSDAGF